MATIRHGLGVCSIKCYNNWLANETGIGHVKEEYEWGE